MKSRSPRVSVIIIFFDEERFLDEAIDSVRSQSYANWELILVDDGSSDGSPAIARAVADADRRVRYLTHPGGTNRGMSASRNLGIAAARGELIAFLDADDIWERDKLAEQVQLFAADPELDMAYGRTLIWHEWNSSSKQRDFCYDLGVEPGRRYPPGALFPVLVANRAQTPTTINAIMRRELVERVGGFDDRFRGMFEDQVFFAKAHLEASCHVDDRLWARYRQHEGSYTNRVAGTAAELKARRRFLDRLADHVRTRGLGNASVWMAIARARLDLVRSVARYRIRRFLRRV